VFIRIIPLEPAGRSPVVPTGIVNAPVVSPTTTPVEAPLIDPLPEEPPFIEIAMLDHRPY
jgi:hypothetical protein